MCVETGEGFVVLEGSELEIKEGHRHFVVWVKIPKPLKVVTMSKDCSHLIHLIQ